MSFAFLLFGARSYRAVPFPPRLNSAGPEGRGARSCGKVAVIFGAVCGVSVCERRYVKESVPDGVVQAARSVFLESKSNFKF